MATFVIISTKVPLSMERAEYLLLKILEQLRRNESKDQLLDSIKLLQDEIERSFPDEEPVSTAITEVFT
ncbi:MAG: hypothetical protein ACK42F_05145, partial [Sphingobacteriales bacterium]